MIGRTFSLTRTQGSLAYASGANSPSSYQPLVKGRRHSIAPPAPAGMRTIIAGENIPSPTQFGNPLVPPTPSGFDPFNPPPASAVIANTNPLGISDAEMNSLGMVLLLGFAVWFFFGR